MKRDLRILALLTLLFATFSCGSRQEAPSAPSFAHLKYAPMLMIYWPNGTTIRHCGGYSEELRRAITLWGEAIGRSYQFAEDCRDPMIQIHPYGSSVAIRECEKTGIKSAFARPNVDPQLIVECNPDLNHFQMVMHETGHLFGMGDTYGDWTNNVNNQYSRDVAESGNSVMNDYYQTTLTADDIIGIHELTLGKTRFGSSSGLRPYRATGDNAKELIESLKPFVSEIDRTEVLEDGTLAQLWYSSERHLLTSCGSASRCWVWSQEPDRLARFKLDSAASERLYKILWTIRATPTKNEVEYTPPNQQTYGTDLDVHNVRCKYVAPELDGNGYQCDATFTTN
jgi:hypothetical protein